MVVILGYLASAHASFRVQVAISIVLVFTMMFLKLFRSSRASRTAFLMIATFMVLRYLVWRVLYTVEYTEWVSFTCAVVLLLAELYGITVALCSSVVNLCPLDRRPVPLPFDEEAFPTVDVMVPSYNESVDLLETTLMGAVQMNYPKSKMKVYLLDDGGTDQKCQKGSVESVAAARARRAALESLCAEIGAHYLTRPQNRHAKAGNINEAMARTDGELLVILDADHVPTTDFLEKTVGFFLQDPNLFLVQTPHFLINPDPVERNLDTFQKMPGENDMFYREIQRGLDFWNAAFFCGSGAVLRRRILETVKGISISTITEDADTAMTLHAKGYNSVYLASPPLLSGLAAETMSGFIRQRTRWAQGMTQIFLLKCPLFYPGLTIPQRICYFNSCFFWGFPFARIIYMLAPAAFLLFGLRIYAANWEMFFAYCLPYLFAMTVTTQYLFGKARWSFVSELYELIQSIHTIPAILSTVWRPHSPTFKVTPKQETLEEDFISPVAGPFYVLALINIFSMGVGIYQFIHGSTYVYPLLITIFWTAFNLLILTAALGALYERRQVRSSPRISVEIPAEVEVNGQKLLCSVQNISLGGCRLFFPWGSESALENQSEGSLRVQLPSEDRLTSFHVSFKNYRDEADSGFTLGVGFMPQSLQERLDRVRFVTGSSERWEEVQNRRASNLGVIKAFLTLVTIGVKRFIPHLDEIASHLFGGKKKRRALASISPTPKAARTAPMAQATTTPEGSSSITPFPGGKDNGDGGDGGGPRSVRCEGV